MTTIVRTSQEATIVRVGEPAATTVRVTGVAQAGPPGPAGPTGPAGSAGAYTHTQANPANVWTVQHNLGYFPAGWLVKAPDGNAIGGIVTHVNVNSSLITFIDPYAGTAFAS